MELIHRWQRRRVVVLGDFMLDHLVYGNAERLSPDAPVPVLTVVKETYAGGGAASVCLDLAALGCDVVCLGVAGEDAAGAQLRQALAHAGCDPAGLIPDGSRPTTLKRSYIGLAQHRHPQKMFRVDYEDRRPLEPAVRDALLASAERLLAAADVVCIEDYNKGVVDDITAQALIEMGRRAGLPVLVDPAAIHDYARYRGATLITPNRSEAELATGLSTRAERSLPVVAERLLSELDLEAVVLTLDRDGALLLERDAGPRTLPTVARNVYDVSGAGDMVLAALAAARAQGTDWTTAVELANVAAGLEVEAFGVVPIPLEDIQHWLVQTNRRAVGKLRTEEALAGELAVHRRHGRKIVFTNGCFDILHAGHVEMLRGARGEGDLLVLAVNSDASIRALKGNGRPIVEQSQRVRLLCELECVDYVILFGDGSGGEADTPLPLLKRLRPDVLVKGGTYAHDAVVGWQWVESYGGKVVTIAPVAGLSTTQIVARIRAEVE